MIISKCNSNFSELNRTFRIGRNPCPARKNWMEARGGSRSCTSSSRGRWHGGQDRPPSWHPAYDASQYATCPRRRFHHLPIALKEVVLQKSCRGRSCRSQGKGHSMGFPVGFLCLTVPSTPDLKAHTDLASPCHEDTPSSTRKDCQAWWQAANQLQLPLKPKHHIQRPCCRF